MIFLAKDIEKINKEISKNLFINLLSLVSSQRFIFIS